jgi:hypothetical protein
VSYVLTVRMVDVLATSGLASVLTRLQ